MRAILYLVVLAALVYGVMYVYNENMADSVNRAVDNTANFATDANVKNFNPSGTGTVNN